MCFSSPQERQLHNEKCVCVCVCVCVCWGGQDQRCTYSVWCLEMGKCRHKSGFLLFVSLSLDPPWPALLSPWLQPCLLGLRESLIPSGGDSDGAKFPLCSSQNFHFRMQAIPSRTWLKINLKKKRRKKKKQKTTWDAEEKWLSRGREAEWSEQMWKSCSTFHLAHLDICQMWQTVLSTTQTVLIFICVLRSMPRRTEIEFFTPLFHTLTPLASFTHRLKIKLVPEMWFTLSRLCALRRTYRGAAIAGRSPTSWLMCRI